MTIQELDEYIRKMTSIKRTNTDEEVQFERRDNEISKSTDDVNLKCCNIFYLICFFIFQKYLLNSDSGIIFI